MSRHRPPQFVHLSHAPPLSLGVVDGMRPSGRVAEAIVEKALRDAPLDLEKREVEVAAECQSALFVAERPLQVV